MEINSQRDKFYRRLNNEIKYVTIIDLKHEITKRQINAKIV